MSKFDAARNAAAQALASITTAETAVAAAESALEAARQRLENDQRKHQERLAAVRAEEAALIAPVLKVAGASFNDGTTKARSVLSWIYSIAGTGKLLNVPPCAVFALQSLVLAVQQILKHSIYDAVEPTTNAPADQGPSMSQSIKAVLSCTDIAVTDMYADAPEAAVGSAEDEAARAGVKAVWFKLKENGGNEVACRNDAAANRRTNKSEGRIAYGSMLANSRSPAPTNPFVADEQSCSEANAPADR